MFFLFKSVICHVMLCLFMIVPLSYCDSYQHPQFQAVLFNFFHDKITSSSERS